MRAAPVRRHASHSFAAMLGSATRSIRIRTINERHRPRRHGRRNDRGERRARPLDVAGAGAGRRPRRAGGAGASICWRRSRPRSSARPGPAGRSPSRPTSPFAAIASGSLAESIRRFGTSARAGQQRAPPGARSGPAAGGQFSAVLGVQPGHLAGVGARQRQRHVPDVARGRAAPDPERLGPHRQHQHQPRRPVAEPQLALRRHQGRARIRHA